MKYNLQELDLRWVLTE